MRANNSLGPATSYFELNVHCAAFSYIYTCIVNAMYSTILLYTNRTLYDSYGVDKESGTGLHMHSFSVATDPAAVLSTSQNLSTSEGQAILLECTLDGNPLFGAHVRWTRDGIDMLAGERAAGALSVGHVAVASTSSNASSFSSSAQSSLVKRSEQMPEAGRTHVEFDDRARRTRLLVNPAVPQDSGVYRCSANNGIGRPEHNFFAQVAESPPISVIVECELQLFLLYRKFIDLLNRFH